MNDLLKRIDRIAYYKEMLAFVTRVGRAYLTRNFRRPRSHYNGTSILPKSEGEPLICDAVETNRPLMVGRFGSTEMQTTNHYLRCQFGLARDYSAGIYDIICRCSGVFPARRNVLDRFCEVYLESLTHVDILAAWNFIDIEGFLVKHLAPQARLVSLSCLGVIKEAPRPWSACLSGKRVLVVHPFRDSILRQYEKRALLFKNPLRLPEFRDLTVIKAVQSLGGNSDFHDWHEALQCMKNEMDRATYDIALIGAGAYGFPLAAHVKSRGKQAIHVGGALQMLFGIYGGRWEDNPEFKNMINEHWIRPAEQERPANFKNVENGCYW